MRTHKADVVGVRAVVGFRSKRKCRDAPFNGNTSEVNNRAPLVASTPTRRNSAGEEITQAEFDRLLVWLNADREKAGEKYEWIRKRLIKVFVCRGSNNAEDLADRTINRVIRKLPEIQATYVGDPAHYFIGVAPKIWLESIKREQPPAVGMPARDPANDDDPRYTYLEKCLEQLTAEDRDLVVSYYEGEGQAKIEHRKILAARLGLGINALRIRACRIRSELQDRIEACR
jgi:DNA-directed RNA polymerase specialized sigma24 family protein